MRHLVLRACGPGVPAAGWLRVWPTAGPGCSGSGLRQAPGVPGAPLPGALLPGALLPGALLPGCRLQACGGLRPPKLRPASVPGAPGLLRLPAAPGLAYGWLRVYRAAGCRRYWQVACCPTERSFIHFLTRRANLRGWREISNAQPMTPISDISDVFPTFFVSETNLEILRGGSYPPDRFPTFRRVGGVGNRK